jgi:diguanylate cyclase (GGDEF)-like protein
MADAGGNPEVNYKKVKLASGLEFRGAKSRAELEADKRRLAEMANTDHLTGLLSRRAFDNELGTSISHAKRFGERLRLIFIDADDFKNVNSKYGRLVGDEVLKSVANAMRMTFRSDDLLARWGGDEFVVIGTEEANDSSFDIDNVQNRLNSNLHLSKPKGVDESYLGVTVGTEVWNGTDDLKAFQQKVQDHMDSRK